MSVRTIGDAIEEAYQEGVRLYDSFSCMDEFIADGAYVLATHDLRQAKYIAETALARLERYIEEQTEQIKPESPS